MTIASSAPETGLIGEVYENGLPVIYSFVNEKPSVDSVTRLPWLTIISWKYDGSNNNGMPLEEVNEELITLENLLSEKFESTSNSYWVFNRTGNHIKEFAYYINDCDAFMEALNLSLISQPRYPIEIKFYDDPSWEQIRSLREEFSGK